MNAWKRLPVRLIRDRSWPFAAVRIAVLAGLAWYVMQRFIPAPSTEGSLEELWPHTDFSRATVPLDQFEPGGPPKDGIPSIDNPRFVTADRAAWLDGQAPVIVVEGRHTAKAYPLEVLIWHEIVNDEIGGRPIAVTFCPLCNATLVFDRRIGERVLEFGTTGWLRMSDLVMYDRQTESLWQQFTGEALAGELAGARLAEIPARIVGFQDFATAYPGGLVLSRRTGYRRPYGENPYVGYDSLEQSPLMPSADARLRPMERVLAVTAKARQRVYPFGELRGAKVINDDIHEVPVAIFSRDGIHSALDQEQISASRTVPAAVAYDRRVEDRVLVFEWRDGRIVDRQTGSLWNLLGHAVAGPLQGKRLLPMPGGVHFAFAWLAFNPLTEIYRGAEQTGSAE